MYQPETQFDKKVSINFKNLISLRAQKCKNWEIIYFTQFELLLLLLLSVLLSCIRCLPYNYGASDWGQATIWFRHNGKRSFRHSRFGSRTQPVFKYRNKVKKSQKIPKLNEWKKESWQCLISVGLKERVSEQGRRKGAELQM